MLKAKMTQTAEIDKINNQKVARKVQVYANNEINKVVENKLGTTAYHNGKAYNNPQTLTDLISINKPKIDKEYSKIITNKKTSNTLYHQIQVQRQANEKTIKISQEQYARLQENINAVNKVLNKYEVSLEKYRELNKKYPKTTSRRGIITESITNKNLYTKTGLNIQPNVFGYKEMSALVEAQHRLAQVESEFELAKAQNEEALLKGEEPPNTHKTWIWTGAGTTARHDLNDGQTVPIDEPFIIENSADGQIDEMMYPLDPNVYSSNGFICYCEVEYHNNQENENDKALEIMALDSALRSANSLLGERFEITDNIPAVPNDDYTGEDITNNIKNIEVDNEVQTKNKKVFDQERFDEITTNEEIAEFFDMDYYPNGRPNHAEMFKGRGEFFELYDKQNECYIRVYKDNVNKLNEIDLNNKIIDRKFQEKMSKDELYDYEGPVVNFKDIIKSYTEAPELLKQSTNMITFVKTENRNILTSGECRDYNIDIYQGAFFGRKNSGYYVYEEVMYHEMFHSFDNTFLKFENGRLIYNEIDMEARRRVKLNNSNMEVEWERARQQDHEYQRKNGMMEQDVTTYGEETNVEDTAEMAGILLAFNRRGVDYTPNNSYSLKVKDDTRASGYRRKGQTAKEVFEANPYRTKLMQKWLNTQYQDVGKNKKLERERFERFLVEEIEYQKKYGHQ